MNKLTHIESSYIENLLKQVKYLKAEIDLM